MGTERGFSYSPVASEVSSSDNCQDDASSQRNRSLVYACRRRLFERHSRLSIKRQGELRTEVDVVNTQFAEQNLEENTSREEHW